MAQRFVNEATSQLAPVYAQQEQAITSQVPAIQNLYQTLIQGLQQQGQQQLTTGVAGINEDASRRGVLRSTLPTDARQALQGQISQALLQSQGQLGSQQAGDIANVNEKLGTLRVQRAGNIADLARSLESQDIQQQQLVMQRQQQEYERQAAERNYGLEQQKLAASIDASRRSSAASAAKAPPTLSKNKVGGWEVSGGEYDLAGYARATGKDLITLMLQGDSKDRQAANSYLEKISKYGNKEADKYFQELQRDRPTAFYRGG